MLVKALCGVIYGGVLYTVGQTFEAEKPLANTVSVKAAEKISPEKHNEPKEPEFKKANNDEQKERSFEEVLAESKKKRR